MRTISLFAALVLASCFSSNGPVTGSCGATLSSAGCRSGDSVYTPAVQTIELENRGGGFGPLPPAGPCDPRLTHYALTIASHHLAWELCDVVDTHQPTTAPRNGDRVLTTVEWDALESVLDGLVIDDTRVGCGVDKPHLALTVIADSWTQEYGDSFYNCADDGIAKIHSEALDALGNALTGLAQ